VQEGRTRPADAVIPRLASLVLRALNHAPDIDGALRPRVRNGCVHAVGRISSRNDIALLLTQCLIV